jgi:hypothetical protein
VVLTADESRPEASVYRVPVMPGGGVHPRYERVLAAGVPPREYPGHVIGRRKKQRLKRMALGDCLPGGDGHQRVAVACLRRVRGCLRRLDRDIRTRPACGRG